MRDLNKISKDRKFILFADGLQGVCIAEAVDEGTIIPYTPMKANKYELMDWLEGEWERSEQRREAIWAANRSRASRRKRAKARLDVDTL